MRKIHLITKVPFPNGMASTKRVISLAKAWILGGFDVEIVIYTRTEIYGSKPRNNIGSGIFDGIKFRYIKGTPLRENNVFLRKYNDLLDKYRLKGYLDCNLKEGDIVYIYGQDLSSAGYIKIAHRKGAKFYQELCEIPFGTGIETKKTIRKRELFERDVLPKVDGVIAISDALCDYVANYCSIDCRISKIPILVDFKLYELEDNRKIDDRFIFHSGTLYEQKDGFLSMLEAFGRVQQNKNMSDVRFVSTGNPKGSRHENEIDEIIEKYGIKDKVIFTGYITEEQLKDYLSRASFVVINKLRTQQNIYCFSTKLGEYMAASKAILITDVGEAMNWLEHGKDAYVIPSGDVARLAEGMTTLFNDYDLCTRLGRGAQNKGKEAFSIESNAVKLRKSIL